MTTEQATETDDEQEQQARADDAQDNDEQEDQKAQSDDEGEGEGEGEGRLGEEIDAEERWQDDETVSDKATCPECGEPVHNLRMTCPMCGHEYKDKEYDDDDAGTEFRAGAEIDGDEIGEQVKNDDGAAKTKESAEAKSDSDSD